MHCPVILIYCEPGCIASMKLLLRRTLHRSVQYLTKCTRVRRNEAQCLFNSWEHEKENRFGKAVPLRGIYIEY